MSNSKVGPLSEEEKDRMLECRAKGWTVERIATRFRRTHSTVAKIVVGVPAPAAPAEPVKPETPPATIKASIAQTVREFTEHVRKAFPFTEAINIDFTTGRIDIATVTTIHIQMGDPVDGVKAAAATGNGAATSDTH